MAQRKKSVAGIRLGRRIKQLRKARGMEQADLAATLPGEASRSLISYIVTGRSFPTPSRLVELAEVLGVDLASLFLDGDELRQRLARNILAAKDEDMLILVERLMSGGGERR